MTWKGTTWGVWVTIIISIPFPPLKINIGMIILSSTPPSGAFPRQKVYSWSEMSACQWFCKDPKDGLKQVTLTSGKTTKIKMGMIICHPHPQVVLFRIKKVYSRSEMSTSQWICKDPKDGLKLTSGKTRKIKIGMIILSSTPLCGAFPHQRSLFMKWNECMSMNL